MPRRYRDWLRQAEADLAAAYDLYRCGHWSWCCFICQQSAEKSIKAILEYYGRATRGHNLVEMIKEVEKHVDVPREVIRACYILNRYYITTRYPNAFVSGAPVDMFTREDAEEALRYAEEVLKFARRVIQESFKDC